MVAGHYALLDLIPEASPEQKGGGKILHLDNPDVYRRQSAVRLSPDKRTRTYNRNLQGDFAAGKETGVGIAKKDNLPMHWTAIESGNRIKH